MAIQAQSADGVLHEFPDGTSPAVIDGAMRDYALSKAPAAPRTVKAAPPPQGIMGNVTGFMANLNRGMGVGDELAAGFHTAGDLMTGKSGPDIGQTFRDEMARQRATEDGYAAAHPHMAALARGTGNAALIAAPAGPGAEAFAGGNLMTNAVRGATTAGLTGAAYAAADRGTPQERLMSAARAAHDPVTLGFGAVSGGLATRASKVAPAQAAAPGLDELTAAKNAAYKAVDDSGVRYRPEAFNSMMEDTAAKLDAEGFNAGLHPKTASMMQRIGESQRGAVGPGGPGYAPTATQLDQLRQQIGRDVASSPDPGERRMGAIMRDQIDQFMGNAGPEHIIAGDPVQAAADLAKARDLNTRVAKLRSLDNLDEAAADRAAVTGSGGNINNTTRQNVLRFKNATGNLTPAEQAAAQKVIDGTMTGNVLRQVGKLSPEGNGLMTAVHLLGAIPSHGATVAVAGAGAIAKRAADALTSGNVTALRNLIASGGEAASEVAKQLEDPMYADLRRQVANDLAVQSGVQGASARSRPPASATAHR